VKLETQPSVPSTRAAAELGVERVVPYQWTLNMQSGRRQPTPGKLLKCDTWAELGQVKRGLAPVKTEYDNQEWALGYFAKDST
jgi:transposase-like protein